jgi:outer membrane PBP1 activator LpoA protein
MDLKTQEERLQAEYNRLCSLYGDALLKLRYWQEQKDLLEKQIDSLSTEKQKIEYEKLLAEKKDADASQTRNDGSSDQAEAS